MAQGYRILWIAGVSAVVVGAAAGVLSWYHHTRTTATTVTANRASVEIQVGPSEPVQTGLGQEKAQRVAELAREAVAQPPSDSLDASGFVQYVFQEAGVRLPRTVLEQSRAGMRINDPSQLMPGDLVFFHEGDSSDPVTFVAIDVGDGKAAARTTHGFTLIDVNTGYWADKFRFGVRVTG